MQVPVETLDAFRIVKHLQQQGEDIACMDDFWERYTEPALLNECGFFVYFLKTQGPEEACIFLQDNRCRIHTVNPRACRIYPLVVDPKEKERGLLLLMQQAAGKREDYVITKNSLRAVTVFRVDVKSLSCKKHGSF